MKANVGNIDKWIRVVLGVVIIFVGLFFQSWWGLIGLLPLVTGLFNYCPAYSLIGASTKTKVDTEKLKIK
jgi:hypothetical protein